MSKPISTELFPQGAALIVGGSGGIGSFVAREFANAGCDVALTYRTKKDVADKLAAELGAAGRKVTAHEVTIGDADQVEAMLKAAIAAHGRIHTVVYACATLTHQVYISEITHEQWKAAVEQDLNGFFNVIHATLPHFRASGGGSYVNLGSAGDLRWPDRDGLSVIPKAAIESLIKGLAREEGKYGVRANTVLVGVIEAGMFLELTKSGALDQAWVDQTHRLLGLKRWGQPEEVGYAAVFLASNRAAYVTGQQLAVAGGFGV